MRRSTFIALIIFLLSAGVSIYFNFQLPDQIISHWNTAGEPDGYMSKFWGLFLAPLILLGMVILFILIPRLDPLKKNIEDFRKYFDGLILLICLFIALIHVMMIFWNVGLKISPNTYMPVAMFVLCYFVGEALVHSKRNWFVGIRTPWTLSSDEVWSKTHRLGGLLFKISGFIALLGLIFENLAIWFIMIPVIVTAIASMAYSYFIFKKINNN